MVADDRLRQLRDAVDDPVRWAFLTGVALIHAGRASLLLRDRGTSTLIPFATLGIDEETALAIRVPVGKGIAGMVAERGIVLAGDDEGTGFLCVPVITDRGVEGVLNLTNRQDGKQFDDDDIALAATVAQHIGRQLEAARRTSGAAPDDLPGKALFEDLIDRELARSRRTGNPLIVALVRFVPTAGNTSPNEPDDMERFLAETGEKLRRVVRRYDVVSHYGPDSLGLLILASPNDDEAILQRVSGVIAATLEVTQRPLGCRIGVARCPANGISVGELTSVAWAATNDGERVEVSS